MDTNSVYSINSSGLKETDGMSLLFARAKKGEDAAFAEIYNLFFKKIYRFIFFRVGHKEVAEDLAEEVFLKAFSKISSVNEGNAFEGWVYQIARNLVIDYYRQKKSIVALEEIENTLEYETNVIDVVNLHEQQKIFLKLLKELGAEQQVVIKLKFFEELENSEIADLLGKNEGAIRVIQHRAIIKLQELIKKSGQQKDE
jgi:RNA polymerase sigma-70 factor (ECF subfamily)